MGDASLIGQVQLIDVAEPERVARQSRPALDAGGEGR